MPTEQQGVGTYVNDVGYMVMNNLHLDNKLFLRLALKYTTFTSGLVNVRDIYLLIFLLKLHLAKAKLGRPGISSQLLHLELDQSLMLKDNSVDVSVNCYSLEYLYPLRPYLENLKRVFGL